MPAPERGYRTEIEDSCAHGHHSESYESVSRWRTNHQHTESRKSKAQNDPGKSPAAGSHEVREGSAEPCQGRCTSNLIRHQKYLPRQG